MPPSLHPYRMAWSFKIGRLFGIDVRVHLIFLVLIAYFCLDAIATHHSLIQGAWVLFYILLLFGFVLLHELGHSLMAQRAGIRVRDITLWPLGGLARLEGQAKTPASEFRIALAGPAVNLAFALVAFPIYYFYPFQEESLLKRVCYLVLGFNLMMGVFNLLPAFPMDGGRILRAYLARKLPYLRATEIAVSVGRVVVVAAIISDLIYDYCSFTILLIIALFVLWAGSSELRAVRIREFLKRAGMEFPDETSAAMDADVVSAQTVDGEGEHKSQARLPEDGEPDLKPFEQEFIDQVRRHMKGEE